MGGHPIEAGRVGEDLANVVEQRNTNALSVGEFAGGELSESVGDEPGPVAASELGDGKEGTPVVRETVVGGCWHV